MADVEGARIGQQEASLALVNAAVQKIEARTNEIADILK